MVDNNNEALDLLFGEPKALWRPETRHEGYLLLAAVYDRSEVLRELICSRIAAGPPDGESPDADWADRKDGQIFEVLSFLKKRQLPLSNQAETKLSEIVAAHPKWQPLAQEGMSHWMSSGSIGRGSGASSFSEMNVEDLVPAIASFKPEWNASLRDVGETIGVRVSKDFAWGARAIAALSERILELPKELFNPILWGVRATLSDNSTKLTAETVAQLIASFRTMVALRSEAAVWSSLPSVLEDLIAKFSIPPSVWAGLVKGLREIFESYDFDRESEKPPIGWLDRAINHPYGDLTQIFLKLSQEDVKKQSSEGAKLVLNVESKGFFDATADQYGIGSRYGHCLVAERMSWMEVVSPDFARTMQEWFLWDRKHERALVAWSGYLWSRTLSRSLVEKFGVTYLEAARHHAEFARSEREGLASHLAAIFWFNQDLRPRAYETVGLLDRDMRRKLLHDWKIHLQSASQADAESFFGAFILPYWDWCSRQPFFSQDEADAERFDFFQLLPYSYDRFPEASRCALKFKPRKTQSFFMFLKDIIAKDMFRFANELTELLIVLVHLEPHPHLEQKEWKEIWQQLETRKPNGLHKLENELAKRAINVR